MFLFLSSSLLGKEGQEGELIGESREVFEGEEYVYLIRGI